ncbi:MAG: class I SAM-dependent methyltransferase [Cyclobacteriaceae bacterium]
MDVGTLKAIAQQLRQPEGEQGIQLAKKMNEGNLYINRFTIDALQLRSNEHVLEIGMGNGFFVKDILSIDDSLRYAGCDFSPVMVEEARIVNKKFIQSKRAQFHLAPADELPFQNEAFDKVFTVNTIYFWEDVGRVFSEIRRVLRPEGRLVISLRPKSIMKHYPLARFGFRLFSKEDISQLIKKNSFVIKDVIEKKEPDQEINGAKVPVETLVLIAGK